MGFQDVISRHFVQTVVYWGNPENDGYGGYTYDEPVEVNCRLENVSQLTRDAVIQPGDEFLSRAVIYVNQDLEVGGLIYIGSLDDLDSEEASNPKSSTKQIYEIRRFEKNPVLGSSTQFLRRAFLAPWLTLNT